MNALLPPDLLHGLPRPSRRRWQPLRAGIVGLFRYDQQEFTFYRGRLLLRGNNGSGKSMALEVLLPFVLDAKLAAERLSTFGGRERGMYLWLLGHEADEARTNARGYVWVEFGRLTGDGDAEYCTVGAGMQATRSSKRVTASWFFTTAARIGVDFEVGVPGGEPVAQAQLDQRLVALADAGLPGAVHPNAETHRKEVNRILFGLEDRQFDALRTILLHLRRPKLSDKLNESKLDEVLREALPPVSASVTDELADGFEKLERHRDVVGALKTARDSLATVAQAYATYLNVLVGLRAQDVLGAATAAEARKADVQQATELHRVAGKALEATREAKTAAGKAVRQLTERIRTIEGSDLYREGSQLVPLQEKATALADVAKLARGHANDARTAMTLKKEAASTAEQTALEAHERRVQSAAEADRIAAALPHRTLVDQLEALVAELTTGEPATSLVDAALARFREAVANESESLDRLIALVDRAGEAADAHEKARQKTVAAKELLTKAEAGLTDARSKRREALEEFTRQLDIWLATCLQLAAGAKPPTAWPETAPLVAAQDWARMAAGERRGQLSRRRDALNDVRPDAGQLGRRAGEFASQVRGLGESLSGLRPLADETRTTRFAFADLVGDWLGQLTELPAAEPIPEALRARNARSLDRRQVLDWATGAARSRSLELGRRESAAQNTLSASADAMAAIQAEHDRLAAGGSTAPPVPFTRLADRAERPGAPFYLLVDFTEDDRSAVDRAALEAALVGAGLADAWVSPDGTLTYGPDDAPLLDTQFVTVGRDAAEPVSTALRPDPSLDGPDAPVSPAVVETLLRQIRLTDTAATAHVPGDLVVAWDGSWAAGGLRGAWHKAQADLIGAAGREAHRRRRMAELETELAALRSRHRAQEAALEKIRESIQTVDSEHRSVPADDAVQAADLALTTAVQQLSGAANRLVEAADAYAADSLRFLRTTTESPLLGDFPWAEVERRTGVAAPALGEAALAVLTAAAGAAMSAWSGPAAPTADSEVEGAASAARACETRFTELSSLITTELTRCGEAETELEAELAAIPSGTALDQAGLAVAVATRVVADESSRLEGRRTAEREARQRSDDAAQARQTALELAGLADRAASLPSFKEAAATMRSCGEDWLNATSHATRQAAHARALRGEADQMVMQAETMAGQAEESEESARLATEKYEDLMARMGKPHQEMLVDLERCQTGLAEQKVLHRKHQEDELKLTTRLEQRRGAVVTAESELAKATGAVAVAAASFADVHRLGLLATLPAFESESLPTFGDVDLRPDQIELVRDWAGRVAGQAPQRRYRPEQLDSAQTKLGQRRQEAEEPLGSLVMLRERVAFRVVTVTGTHNGRERPLPAAVRHLDREIAGSEQLLESEESDLFEKFLSDEVRLEVGRRIDSAKALVDRANELMKGHPTSSGIRFKLVRTPDPQCEMPRDMMELLRKPEGTLYAGERDRLSDFFKRRIVTARSRATLVPWRQQLAELLDYRRWYRFALHYRQRSGDWAVLDRRAHGSLSGGEKAVALHMPLFAAAATHCEASRLRVDEGGAHEPGCPRLILLDEVFAGVDTENRGALFDLIRRLDLDLVATSESELGLYAELDGLSIYHLIVDDALPGVLAVRSVWDGRVEHHLLEHDLEKLP
ncbi:SbcC/MukB-like Walker B domain-containing protein [Amycolatopsis sp. NPDC004378]